MRGQTAKELVWQRHSNVSVASKLCGLSRQAFYQCKADWTKKMEQEEMLLSMVRELREEDPGIGCYKLWRMLRSLLGEDNVMGRDSFHTLLQRRKLMLPAMQRRHTTNSNHHYRKWKNRIKGFIPTAANQLWVADITYIPTAHEMCYLHLITDAYSHKIVGWHLADTLAASASLVALEMALQQAIAGKGSPSLKGLVHHSDRGVQYCCNDYVSKLQEHDITISMTEDYKPTDNAIAERINGVIKNEVIYRKPQFSDRVEAHNVIARFISFYNHRRPHMSIDYKTPNQAHGEHGVQRKRWKTKVYNKNIDAGEKNSLPLQHQSIEQNEHLSTFSD